MNTIGELFRGIPCRLSGISRDRTVRGISSDSRTAKSGDLFVAVKGSACDGHDFIADAIARGAAAVCSERPMKDTAEIPAVTVGNSSAVLPVLASRFYGNPAQSLKIIGVTGTNGKTTTAHLVYEVGRTAGRAISLLGTVEYRIGANAVAASRTTPGPLLLHSLFKKMQTAGSAYVAMEVSSHALKQRRIAGIRFSSAALTNITEEHLDYHLTMRDYADSKKALFESLDNDSTGVLNRDDAFYNEFKRSVRGRVISYGMGAGSDFRASRVEADIGGLRFRMDTPNGPLDLRSPLIGAFNVYNILAAGAIAFAEGIEMETVREAVRRFTGAPGRAESVHAGQPFTVLIDYAHTDDALEKILSSARQLAGGKVVLVFGCGGDRDRTKRPKMGRVAGRQADIVILTNDNPRSEHPCAIIDEIEKGFEPGFSSYKKIPDRRRAIEAALTGRGARDIVIIAGKGHEDRQWAGGRAFPFNDKNIAEEILRKAKIGV